MLEENVSKVDDSQNAMDVIYARIVEGSNKIELR